MHNSIDRSGAGTGGTRNISGNRASMLRWDLARGPARQGGGARRYLRMESNLATLSTLGQVLPEAIIFSDH
jgi:5-aminolevulinate synthase